jgi:prepilin-type processing-associated H-X9-DG protein
MAYILPYVEQDNALAQARAYAPKDPYSWRNPTTSLSMKMFTCPADPRGSQTYPASGGLPAQALTMYLGNSGTTSNSFDGVLYMSSKVRITDIIDGSSNTLLVGERPPNSNLEFGWWFAAYGYDGRGNGDCVIPSNDLAVANYFISNYSCTSGATAAQKIGLQPGNPNVGCDAAHYWSFHTGGAQFLMGDGSARMITDSNNSIIAALSTRAGGEVATPN